MNARDDRPPAPTDAETGTEAWRAAARHQPRAAADHADFYTLAGEAITTLQAPDDLFTRRTRGRRAGSCPRRRNLHPVASDTKSRAGRRVIGMPSPLVGLLREHRAEQDRDRQTAGQLWHEGYWIFTSPTGEAINFRTDIEHWKDLLREAGVRDVRLDDARDPGRRGGAGRWPHLGRT